MPTARHADHRRHKTGLCWKNIPVLLMGRAVADSVAYVESSDSWSTSGVCRWTSWSGGHRTCPSR
ncbi:MAG: hypothetical protein FJW36_05445 [Acidobacteria bacterium]|nr:hypothetical protein [Acidobacteriota bacterium]